MKQIQTISMKEQVLYRFNLSEINSMKEQVLYRFNLSEINSMKEQVLYRFNSNKIDFIIYFFKLYQL